MVFLPFLITGILLNFFFPAMLDAGGPPLWLRTASAIVLICGLVIWIWSVVLIVVNIPKKKLITTGPYALVKHPLYSGVSLLVFPAAGLLLNSWLGLILGVILYALSRIFSRIEEKDLERSFGEEWKRYSETVSFPRI